MTKPPRRKPDPESEFRRWGGPAWRYQVALNLIDSATRPPANLDARVREAMAFERRRREPGGVERAEREFPLLAAAARAEEHDETAKKLRLLTLGTCDHDTIAKRLGVPAEVLETWEKLYYDIRPNMSATDWIAASVITAELETRGAEFVARAKLAFGAGVGAALAMLDADAQLPMEEAERLVQVQVRLAAKCEQALAMPVTPDTAFQFIRLQSDNMVIDKKLKLGWARLEQRCIEAANKNKLLTLQFEERVHSKTAKQKERERIAAAKQEMKAAREAAKRGPSPEELLADQRRQREEAEASAAACPLSRLTWAPEPSQPPAQLEHQHLDAPVVVMSMPEESNLEDAFYAAFVSEESIESELVCTA